MNEITKNTLYLIYDGDCILCRNSAQAIKIKKSVGNLELINARESHFLVKEALNKGYDLNAGIIVNYNDKYYYGADAVNFLALIGSNSDLFNKINSFIFKYQWTSKLFYPFFKFLRNTILFFRRIPAIPMPAQQTLIEKIFNEKTPVIPKILKERYFNRPYSSDSLLLKGEVNVTISKVFQFLSPLLRLTGASAPYAAKKITATVEFISNSNSHEVLMRRTLFYLDRPAYSFSTRVIHIKDNIVLEIMRFGFASRLIYTSDKNKIIMNYGGYVLCIGKILIPMPLGFLIGKFSAYEEANADDTFNMLVKITHPIFGKLLQYDGCFKIENMR